MGIELESILLDREFTKKERGNIPGMEKDN